MSEQELIFTITDDEGTHQVALERWVWIATYDVGDQLYQFDSETQRLHRFAEIDQSRLTIFQMVDSKTGRVVTIRFPKGAKLIHQYRTAHLEVGTEDERVVRLYLFGYEMGSIHCHFTITPDDEVIFSDDFNWVTVG